MSQSESESESESERNVSASWSEARSGSGGAGPCGVTPKTASERRGNNLQGFDDFYLTARSWTGSPGTSKPTLAHGRITVTISRTVHNIKETFLLGTFFTQICPLAVETFVTQARAIEVL